ncbi:MAG: hypothetical protein AB7S44_03740 [Spirochaetales bacterium]
METRIKRKELIDDRRKKQIVHNWLSSFVITSVVAVSAIVASPASSITAHFLELANVGTDIYYQVEVMADENALDDGSLKIVADNNIETVESEIYLGESEGFFYDLMPNTTYKVSIMGSAGFGEYAIETQTVYISNSYGGTLLGAEFTPDEYQEGFTCSVHGIYTDSKNQISEVYVDATYFITGEGQMGEEGINLGEQTILDEDFYFELYSLPYMNGYLRLTLYALLNDETTVVLDEKNYYAPTVIHAYAYVDYIGLDFINFVLYPDSSLLNSSYYVLLNSGGELVERIDVELVPDEYMPEYLMGYITFEGLNASLDYVAEFYVNYTDSITSEEKTQMFLSLDFGLSQYNPPIY